MHFAVVQWLLQEYSDDAVSNGSEGEQRDGYPDSDDYQDEDQDNYSDDDFDEAAGAQDSSGWIKRAQISKILSKHEQMKRYEKI